MNSKIKGPLDLYRIVWHLKRRKRRIITTNGCFDILHKGHVDYLRKAKGLGDVLIVAINSDEVIKKLKGKDRPINDALSRAEVLAALSCVDYVTIFIDRDPIRFVSFIKPHVHVKAADYTVNQIIEYKAIKAYGGKLALMDYLEGHSTTDIINKLRK